MPKRIRLAYTSEDGISLVQPNGTEVPAPYSQMVGGVDFLADADAGMNQFFRPFSEVCFRYHHNIQGFSADLEIRNGFHSGTGIGQHLI